MADTLMTPNQTTCRGNSLNRILLAAILPRAAILDLCAKLKVTFHNPEAMDIQGVPIKRGTKH